MFIKYEDISNEVLIDARTNEEFLSMPLFHKNIPIINSKSHSKIKKFYPCAIFVILLGLYRNRLSIKRKLLEYSQFGSVPIVVGCSRGRLRSPILCLYARFLGIDAKVLSRGIKRFYAIKKSSFFKL